MQKICSWIFVVFGLLHALFPITPSGEKLNLDGYTLLFADEFTGDALNTDAWLYRASGARRTGYNAPSQVRVQDGNLILRAEYLQDGEYGPGWYTGMIALRQKYTNGYFEIRCKCSRDRDCWSAFWLQSENSYDHERSAGGIGGAEVDIFEAMECRYFSGRLANAVKSTIYCNGTDALENRIDRCRVGKYYVDGLYEEFHTFGLKWTKDSYIFYIDGVESGRSGYGKGVSQVPEEVIVSLELPDQMAQSKERTVDFTVDYVKIWSADE